MEQKIIEALLKRYAEQLELDKMEYKINQKEKKEVKKNDKV